MLQGKQIPFMATGIPSDILMIVSAAHLMHSVITAQTLHIVERKGKKLTPAEKLRGLTFLERRKQSEHPSHQNKN